MRVALPIWEQRISPVFDVAGQLLLVNIQESRVTDRRVEQLPDVPPSRLVATLDAWRVNVVICGGISQAMALLIQGRGIELVRQICGDVEQVINAYLADDLGDPRFRMPGCRDRRDEHEGLHRSTDRPVRPDKPAGRFHEVRIRRIDSAGAGDAAAGGDGRARESAPAEHVRWLAHSAGRQVGRLDMTVRGEVAEIRELQADARHDTVAIRCRLVQAALGHCRERGLLKVVLRAAPRSRRAMQLFRCLGFQHSRDRQHSGGRQTEFYLNLYQSIDEDQCVARIDDITHSAGDTD
jgi:predicted Fe-Mo cluster-binding NifX family protein